MYISTIQDYITEEEEKQGACVVVQDEKYQEEIKR